MTFKIKLLKRVNFDLKKNLDENFGLILNYDRFDDSESN